MVHDLSQPRICGPEPTGPGPKMINLGPDRTRTRKFGEIQDRVGLGPENFENSGGPWIIHLNNEILTREIPVNHPSHDSWGKVHMTRSSGWRSFRRIYFRINRFQIMSTFFVKQGFNKSFQNHFWNINKLIFQLNSQKLVI